MKTKILLLSVCLLIMSQISSQDKVVYQKPPQEILELVDIERAPGVNMDSKGEKMLFFYRSAFKSLSDLNQPELRLGGLRVNPDLNISSTASYINNIRFRKTSDKELKDFIGLPDNPKITNVSFSPDESKIAFTHTSSNGVELWMADLQTLQAKRLTESALNANSGMPYTWFVSGDAILIRTLPEKRAKIIDAKTAIPEGPIVTVSDGQISQNRTYQDLLKNSMDEANFETLMTSELCRVDLSGNKTLWKEAGMYIGEMFSPDGKYLMLRTLTYPFSYVVPYSSFPNKVDIYTSEGEFVTNFSNQPLLDNLPVGFMATFEGKRNINWRSDKPSTLYWVEALDNGDPEVIAEYRDEVFQVEAPFDGTPISLVKTIGRYAGILWGNDTYALINDNWWNTRNAKTYIFNPSDSSIEPRIASDRNYQDVYSSPGSPQMDKNKFGRYSLKMDGTKIYLFGDGFTAEGQFPFIDEVDLKTLKKKRIYQSAYTDKAEEIITFIDSKKGTVVTRIESPTEYPNYYIRNIRSNKAPQQLTYFENPFKSIESAYKEVVAYKRSDGVELNGTLYLPVGYDREKKEKLPLIIWAYPTEFKDKSSAGQNTSNPNTFSYLSYGNPIYWITRGYAVLNDASFPIVGEGDEQPNDTFVEQLTDNAKSAIDAIDKLGYIDRNRVAIGGHSYGAFMTANLLTHTDLFAAGIARSGAYNRTLTPFGFQSEERSYWKATDVYNNMSPFMHADKMKTPLLLVHGEADNNSGTHTQQSERYFQALKSFGAPTRLVILPMESHGYAAKESVLHLLWEQDQWLEQYVKNREAKD